MFRQPSVLKPHKIRRRKQIIYASKIVAAIGLICLGTYGFSWLSRLPALTISHVEVKGNSAVASQAIQENVLGNLQGSYAGILSVANTFFYPKKAITASLPFVSRWIKDISVNRHGLTGLVVTVTERVPVAAWCGTAMSQAQSCKLIDADGVVFADAPDPAGKSYIQYYGALTTPTMDGPIYGTDKQFQAMQDFIKALRTYGLQPAQAETTSETEYSVYLQSGTELLMNSNTTADQAIATLHSLLQDKDFAQAQMDGFTNVQYIDLRFGNKVFYKFRK